MTEDDFNRSVPDFSTGQEFMHLYVVSERRIRAFIYTLVHNWAATDDLMQDTVKVMWVKFGDFERGTDFGAWGLRIARNHVMNYFRRKDNQLVFNTDLVEKLTQCVDACVKDDRRCDALRQCLEKLDDPDRKLIHLRYEIGKTTKDVAKHVGRGVKRVYHSLNRIHFQLSHCVRRTLILEDKT